LLSLFRLVRAAVLKRSSALGYTSEELATKIKKPSDLFVGIIAG
jgi:hypothetical protein